MKSTFQFFVQNQSIRISAYMNNALKSIQVEAGQLVFGQDINVGPNWEESKKFKVFYIPTLFMISYHVIKCTHDQI